MSEGDDLAYLGVAEAGRRIRDGSLSPPALVEALVERSQRLDPLLRSTITAAGETALREAEAAEKAIRRGQWKGPLHGIPFGVKDCIATAGIRTTANSRLLSAWVPANDAPAVSALRRAGAIVISKLNLNEFAWSIPAESDLSPPPRNPWQPASQAMGSSSGSAVAVAAGLCCFALGTDAGGSIRQPAANCGVAGLKPTHGLVDSSAAFGPPSICEVGPIARSVEDIAIVIDALTGSDAYTRALELDSSRPRLGVLHAYVDQARPDPEIAAAFGEALHALGDVGARISDVAVEGLAEAAAADFLVLNAEAFAAHEQTLRARRDGYGPSARLYQTQGAFLSAADYIAALQVGKAVAERVDRALQEVDLLVIPVTPVVTAEAARDAGARPHSGGVAIFTAPFNLTGHPALAIPCGLSDGGVPIGLQLIGRRGGEASLLQVGCTFAKATPWSTMRPPLEPAAASAS
jgi:aspartyl-tRNA(Asn)/glutamyl-tRNA(Gln) amidotransferase subunit A